jgi:phosphoglycerate dehydrogenase-like enzyme
MMPEILLLIKKMYVDDFLPDWLSDRLHALGNVEMVLDPGDLSAEKYAGLFRGRDAVITGWGMPNIDRKVLEQADRLKIISHAGGEMRNFLSEELFDIKPEVVLCHAAGVMSRPVAEHTLCVTLASLRGLFHFKQWVRGNDNWWDYDHSKNRSLIGKKVGIVGLGAIAREFIKLVRPFNVKLLVYSKHLAEQKAAEESLEKAGLDDIFSTCDVVVLCAANTPENYHMINRDLLRKIKPGAVFVNNARGAIVDEQALVEELETGRFMAAIDVTDPEPPAADSKLRNLENVLLTPHTGGPVPEQRYWIMEEAVANLEEFFAGRQVRGVITRDRYHYMA